jgi:hypothetical protein
MNKTDNNTLFINDIFNKQISIAKNQQILLLIFNICLLIFNTLFLIYKKYFSKTALYFTHCLLGFCVSTLILFFISTLHIYTHVEDPVSVLELINIICFITHYILIMINCLYYKYDEAALEINFHKLKYVDNKGGEEGRQFI